MGKHSYASIMQYAQIKKNDDTGAHALSGRYIRLADTKAKKLSSYFGKNSNKSVVL